MASPKVKMVEEPTAEEEVEVPVESLVEEEELASSEDDNPVVNDDDLSDFITVESLDPKETLWENGPTAAQVIEWKAEHGDVYVTSITLDKHVIWRPLTRGEYKKHVQAMEAMVENGQLSAADANLYNEEALAKICMLFCDESTEKLAGLPSIIAQEVLEASGFVALEVRQL